MWEDLKVYRPLDKKEINTAFKKFSLELGDQLGDYSIERTNSIIKIYRFRNNLEQGIFIEKHVGPTSLQVRVCIKPTDFYKKHRFTMVNIVSLGDIMGQYRKSFYSLTQEWQDLASYLSRKIKSEVEEYFARLDSYEKIIKQRKQIEPAKFDFNNRYELLIYAAIKTNNSELLIQYIDKKLKSPAMTISYSEFLKAEKNEVDVKDLLKKFKELGKSKKFEEIEKMLNRFS